MEHDMDFQLANGKILHIKGNQFMVDVLDDTIIVEVRTEYDQKAKLEPFDQTLDQILSDHKPAYFQKKEEPKVIKLSELEQKSPDNDEITRIGKNVFNQFIKKWSQGFGDANAEQPDRADLMNKTMSDYSLHVIRYVRAYGGLTSVTMRAFPTSDYQDPTYRKKMRLLAENVAQVSSVLCPPLSDLLEYPFLIDTQLLTGEDHE
jgi:hypothetical protein